VINFLIFTRLVSMATRHQQTGYCKTMAVMQDLQLACWWLWMLSSFGMWRHVVWCCVYLPQCRRTWKWKQRFSPKRL